MAKLLTNYQLVVGFIVGAALLGVLTVIRRLFSSMQSFLILNSQISRGAREGERQTYISPPPPNKIKCEFWLTDRWRSNSTLPWTQTCSGNLVVCYPYLHSPLLTVLGTRSTTMLSWVVNTPLRFTTFTSNMVLSYASIPENYTLQIQSSTIPSMPLPHQV